MLSQVNVPIVVHQMKEDIVLQDQMIESIEQSTRDNLKHNEKNDLESESKTKYENEVLSHETMREDLDICVCNPVTDKYTTYEIKIQTTNPAFNLTSSCTRRRYNDFCWLRKMLKKHHPMCTCPDLPSKKTFSERFEPQFIVERMKSLEDWILRLLEIDLFLSDTTVHLFLQTNLTCSQMESYVNGRLASAVVRRAYKACRLKKGHSFMRTMSKEPHDPPEPTTIKITPDNEPQPNRPNSGKSVDRSDSGLATSDMSSDNDSLYESQNGYSSSSDIASSFPKITEVVQDLVKSPDRRSISSDCSEFDICASTSMNSNGMTDESIISDYEIIPTPEKSKPKHIVRSPSTSPGKAVKRVEMGVIFSVNSV